MPTCRSSSGTHATASRSNLHGPGWAQDHGFHAETLFRRLADAIALAAPFGQPNLPLPTATNHPDPEARNWLEGYLNGYPHAVILVARPVLPRHGRHPHRRPDAEDATDYVGTYSDHLVEHAHRGAAQGQARAGRRGRAHQDTVDRFHTRRPRPRRSRADRCLDKVADRRPPSASDPLQFPSCGKSGRTVPSSRTSGVRRSRRLETRSCTSSAATASRSSVRTASAS